MLKELGDIAYEPIGDFGLSEPSDELIPIEGGQRFPDYLVERWAVLYAIRICGIQRVSDNLRRFHYQSAEANPFRIILYGDHNRLAITSGIRPVWRDRRVIETGSLGDLASVLLEENWDRHPICNGFE
jgi:hypothetical protein